MFVTSIYKRDARSAAERKSVARGLNLMVETNHSIRLNNPLDILSLVILHSIGRRKLYSCLVGGWGGYYYNKEWDDMNEQEWGGQQNQTTNEWGRGENFFCVFWGIVKMDIVAKE